MKRILVVALTLVVLLSTTVLPAYATTKADLLAECGKSPVYKYIKAAVENAAKTVEITDAQAAELLPLVQRAVAVLSEDKGDTHYDAEKGQLYTDAQEQEIMSLIDQGCKILGFTYKISPAKAHKGYSQHINDIVFFVYDQNGKLIFQYDGDLVANTSAANTVSSSAWVAIACGAAMTVAAAAAFISARKKAVA